MKKWSSFEQHYQSHIGPVYRYIFLRVGNKEETEDLTSQIFLKALEHFDSFDGQKPFAHWIFTIAHNTLVSYYRDKKSTVPLENIAELPNPFDLEKSASDHHDFEQVQTALQALEPEKQQLVEMKYLLGYSYAEMATILGKKESGLKVATFRAVDELKKKLPLPLQP